MQTLSSKPRALKQNQQLIYFLSFTFKNQDLNLSAKLQSHFTFLLLFLSSMFDYRSLTYQDNSIVYIVH